MTTYEAQCRYSSLISWAILFALLSAELKDLVMTLIWLLFIVVACLLQLIELWREIRANS